MALDLTSQTFQQDPYAYYARLREQAPIANLPGSSLFFGGGWLITRYDDVVRALKDPRLTVEQRKVSDRIDGSREWWVPGIFRALLSSMVMVDNPDHARLRNLVHKAFTPRMIQQMGGRIEAMSQALLEQMAGKTTVDLMADFAGPLPITVISEMMGVPPTERHRFHHMIRSFLDAGSLWSMLKQFPNSIALHRFFKRLVALRRREPEDDIISALVQAEEQGDSFSEDELIAMLLLLLLAGHETTVNLIGNGTLALLQHPEELARLQGDAALLESAIEEMLRYTNPVQQIAPRYALEDVELHGERIPKGNTILLGIAAANRDERIFPDADRFDIARKPNPHIAFGLGIHYCLGAPLARLEGRIAFRTLLDRFPQLRLAVPGGELEWRGGPSLRGLKRLPIRLDNRSP
jgi:cytochrome P450